jgi:hypothetical protein
MLAAGSFIGLVIICMWIDKFNPSQFPAAFATSGLVLTFVGLLLLLSYLGAFDTLGYAFTTFRSRSRRPYKDLVEYTEVKTRTRKVQEYFFVPYIVVGLIFFVLGMVNWMFVKPLPKHESPKNIQVVLVSNNNLEITWDKNELASNGYKIAVEEVSEQSDNAFSIVKEVSQTETDKVSITISVPDSNKKYKISIICLATDKYNGSEISECIYDPE